jgi:hypothetical protein
MDTIIVDEKGRAVVRINESGDYLVARYPDMTEIIKQCIVEFCEEVGDMDANHVRRFLDFQSDESFCS